MPGDQKDYILTVRLSPTIRAAMDVVTERHGTPKGEQVRRALQAWLQAQGALKAERKRSGKERRP
ncbi:MAG: hypothetical protein GEV06_09325 [Luteitalea sp.]|nr:hypothetical protein [Luteitalea sp.]